MLNNTHSWKRKSTLHTIVYTICKLRLDIEQVRKRYPLCCLLYPGTLKKCHVEITAQMLNYWLGTLMCIIYDHLKFVSCSVHTPLCQLQEILLPNCKNMLPVRKCYLLESTPCPLWFCFFQVSFPAHHEQYFSWERFDIYKINQGINYFLKSKLNSVHWY